MKKKELKELLYAQESAIQLLRDENIQLRSDLVSVTHTLKKKQIYDRVLAKIRDIPDNELIKLFSSIPTYGKIHS